ncbi:hypothetical protein PRIPAC_96756 [Pristionchus pacificus]|uniref:Uncharacterized protein n=1 Tax=Pristionchus pacificus TaxID=54126 RepID=A0A454Y5X9_PRIPA|nr:hypothetical protein PRIPAC_96756 [Pristionchus pacificus]|eukprot:PDM84253.1 hypothetical protein PRIPAC_33276 [Pristionchus pacificus]
MTYRCISELVGDINYEEVDAELLEEWDRLTEREEILEFHLDRLDNAELEVGTANSVVLEIVEINLELDEIKHLIMENAAQIIEQVRKHRDPENEAISDIENVQPA